MRKVADEEPASKPAKPANALSVGLANPDFQSGPEPLHLLTLGTLGNASPSELDAPGESLWQPIIQATLKHVGQTLLDWCWKAFEQRYGEQLKHLNTARALSSQLLDPQLSLSAKFTALLNVLETSTLTGGVITPYLDVARQLKTLFNDLQQPGSSVIKRGIETLSNLLALLDLPAAQQMASQDTLAPVRKLLSGALDWAQTLQRLSNLSWDTPQSIVDGLLQSGTLPTWVIEIVEQGQKLYETLSSRLTAIKIKGEQLQRLNGLLAQFNEATGTKAKFTALLTLLLDEDMLGLIEQYAPAAMGDSLKVSALFKNAIQDGGEQDTLGLRTTLLSMAHVTSQPFIDRLGSEAGAVGQLMAEPLGNVRAALRGSASQEAAFNLLLGLTDPKKTRSDFLLESSREMLLLPQVQDLGASFASRFAWQAQAVKALYAVLDDTFWAQYKTAAWAELPSLISDTALRDAHNKQSQLAIALAAASGIPGEYIQTVFTEVSRVCRSWGNDSWAEFLPKVTESVNSLLSVLVQHGQVLPTYVQTLLDIGLWAAKGITRLLMLHAVWKAKANDEVLGEASLALIRKAIEEYTGENAAWAFDKAMIWLPMLAPLYKMLGNLEPIKEGQRVQWLANLLIRLYSLPEAQTNKDIIWVREQIEAKAELWLGGIPAAMLGNAIVEEIKSKPGYDLTPMFTRAIQLQGLASYISNCLGNVTKALQGVDVMNGIQAILNPARVQVPGGQRPAYLRDPTTLNFVLPQSHPQQPLSTTGQNIAPIAWGAGAGATFLSGILFTYFAYKSYRKGNQTPSQAEAESDIPLVPISDLNTLESSSTATQGDPLLSGTPYKKTSVPLNQKSSHWKKTGPLAAMASVMFSASAYTLWKTYDAIADNKAREKINALEVLQAKAQNDFNAGNTNSLSDDLTQFTGAVASDENLSVATESSTSTHSTAPPIAVGKEDNRDHCEHNISLISKNTPEIGSPLNTSTKHTHKVKKGAVASTPAIHVLPLMIEATELVKTLASEKSAGKTDEQLNITRDRLAMVVVKLKTLRDDLANITSEQYAEYFTDRETYAYYLLAEMKDYYSIPVANLWGQFAPTARITYTYRNKNGGPEEASAPLINFVNGGVARALEDSGILPVYGFEGPRQESEVAKFLYTPPTTYVPGEWTKKQTLDSIWRTPRGNESDAPSMTDMVTLKVQPIHTSAVGLQDKKMTLDQFLKGEHKGLLGHAPDFFTLKEIQWPHAYTKTWIQSLQKSELSHAYLKGDQILKTIKVHASEEDAKTQAFAASLWTDPETLIKINNHAKLKTLNIHSTITLEITQNDETTRYNMTLVSFLCSEYKRFFPSSISIKIIHPFQLIPSTDSTIQDLIDRCTVARELYKNEVTIDNALNNLKMPTVMGILQERLNQELIKNLRNGNIQRVVSIDNDVDVNYRVYTSDISAEGPVALHNKETKTFKIWEIMGKAHRRYQSKNNWVSMHIDPNKKYDTGVIELILQKDWSKDTEQALHPYPNKSKLKEDWVKLFKPLISSALKNAHTTGLNLMDFDNHQLKITTRDRFKLLGVYRVSTGDQSFELRSIFSTKVWSFKDTNEYNVALNHTPYEPPRTTPPLVETSTTQRKKKEEQNNKELYTWLNQHLQESDKKVNTGNNRLMRAPGQKIKTADIAAEKMFDDYFERLNLDADFYLTSENELLFRGAIKFFTEIAGAFLSMGLPISGPLSMLLSTGLAVLPLAEVAVADSRAEFKELLIEAVIGVALEGGGQMAGKLFPTAMVKSVMNKIKHRRKTIYKSPTGPSGSKIPDPKLTPTDVILPRPSATGLARRTERATLHGITYDFEINDIGNGTLVYSIANSPAEKAIISAHGAYKSTSKSFTAPDNMTLQFLGPHGYKLQNPTVNLMNTVGGIKPHTIISPGGIITHSPLKPGPAGTQSAHTLNTTLKHSTGSKVQGEIRDYSLGHFSGDQPAHIKVAMANNRELVAKGTPGIVITDYVTVNPTTTPTVFAVPTVQTSEVIGNLNTQPNQYKEIIFSFCRVKSPSFKFQSYDPISKTLNTYRVTKGFEETYDMSGKLIKRVFRIFTTPLSIMSAGHSTGGITPAPAPAQQDNEYLAHTFALDKSHQDTLKAVDPGSNYAIAGPFINDEWRRKKRWESGIAFSMFEAMDTSGSVNFKGPGDQLLNLSAKDPIEDNRWKLEWKLNPRPLQRPGTPSPSGTVPVLEGSVTGPMMNDVLKDISTLMPYIINSQDLEVSVYIGKENMRLVKERIIDDGIINIDADVYKKEQFLSIKAHSGTLDPSLNHIEPWILPAYFNTYLRKKNITGSADKSIDILNYLLTLHAVFHSSSWPTPITRHAIEGAFEALSSSPTIAQILTDLLVTNELSVASPIDESPLSKACISSFLRTLMEQAYLDLNFTPDDTGLNRNTMAEKFDQHVYTLVDTYLLNTDVAKWLTVIKYIDADIDGLLSRQQPAYEASSKSIKWTNGIRPILIFEDVGSIQTYKNAEGHSSPVSRKQRARVRIMKNNDYIYEKLYEIPMAYRTPEDMTFYIANAINIDMRGMDFDTTDPVVFYSSFAAGDITEERDHDNTLLRAEVTVSRKHNIPIFSNINTVTNNPAYDYSVIVDFL